MRLSFTTCSGVRALGTPEGNVVKAPSDSLIRRPFDPWNNPRRYIVWAGMRVLLLAGVVLGAVILWAEMPSISTTPTKAKGAMVVVAERTHRRLERVGNRIESVGKRMGNRLERLGQRIEQKAERLLN
jgi:hypothetical protein